MILLPQPLEHWDYGCVSPCPGISILNLRNWAQSCEEFAQGSTVSSNKTNIQNYLIEIYQSPLRKLVQKRWYRSYKGSYLPWRNSLFLSAEMLQEHRSVVTHHDPLTSECYSHRQEYHILLHKGRESDRNFGPPARKKKGVPLKHWCPQKRTQCGLTFCLRQPRKASSQPQCFTLK